MEQSFSKVDRCFDSGRFGPKSADTERRCVSVLTMAENSEQTILQGARRLFAGAVKKYTGPQRRKRMDSGIKKEKKRVLRQHFCCEREKLSQKRFILCLRHPDGWLAQKTQLLCPTKLPKSWLCRRRENLTKQSWLRRTAICCRKTKVQNHLQRRPLKERYKPNKTKSASKLRRRELRIASGFARLNFGIGGRWALGRPGALVWPLTVASVILCSLSRHLVCNIFPVPP